MDSCEEALKVLAGEGSIVYNRVMNRKISFKYSFVDSKDEIIEKFVKYLSDKFKKRVYWEQIIGIGIYARVVIVEQEEIEGEHKGINHILDICF